MATPPKRILIFVCLSTLFITFSCSPTDPLTKSIPQWDTLELIFEGPQTSEDAESNPFLDMRLDVEFTHHTGTIYTIPAFMQQMETLQKLEPDLATSGKFALARIG